MATLDQVITQLGIINRKVQSLTTLVQLVDGKVDDLMATQDEDAASIETIVTAIQTAVTAIQAELAASGTASPALDKAVSDLTAANTSLQALVPPAA